MQIIRQQNARKLHFFDYSLWNHYVKDLFVPLLKYRTIVLCLLFSLIRVGRNYYYVSIFQFSLIRISFALRTSL